jgi:hypothetical protein
MTYATTNPPALQSQLIAGKNRRWTYKSGDNAATVRVSGYFTNGWALGMKAGDLVDVIDDDASPIAVTRHVVVSASATGGVDLDNGVAVSGADSD